MNPYDRAHELARAIRESDAFRAMKAATCKKSSARRLRKFLFRNKPFIHISDRKELVADGSYLSWTRCNFH